jgi:phosphoribosylanthranilate isomerase
VYVKICGLSEPVTLQVALDAGADAVGFVFAPGSPRTVEPSVARQLIQGVPDSVLTVGVFRKQPIDDVLRMAGEAGVNTVQLHGGEPLADFERVQQAGFGTIRALSIHEYLREVERDPVGIRAHRLLIDAPIPGAGAVFDTTELQAHPPQAGWLLAGGLNPGNVAELIRAARPGGVDVSSGVEVLRGQKDPALIRAFVAAARAAG